MTMKFPRMFHVLVLSAAVLSASCHGTGKATGNFSFSPSQPGMSDQVAINYRPAGPVRGAETAVFHAYYLTAGLPVLKAVDLVKSGDRWTAQLRPSDVPGSYGIIGIVKDGKGRTDGNDGKGYVIPFFSEGHPVRGFSAAHGSAISLWGSSFLPIDRDLDRSVALIEKDFQAFPDLKPLFFKGYCSALLSLRQDGYQQKISDFLDAIQASGKTGDEDFLYLFSTYTRLGKMDRAEAVKDKALAAYPKGQLAQMLAYRRIAGEQDVARLKTAFEDFKRDFPGSAMSENFLMAIVNGHLKAGQFEEACAVLEAEGDAADPGAFEIVARQAFNSGAPDALVMRAVDRGTAALEKKLAGAEASRPSYMTLPDWRKDLLTASAPSLFDLKGTLLARAGRMSEAAAAFKAAYEASEGSEPAVIMDHARALTGLGKYDEALAVLGKAVKDARADKEMTGLLRESYARSKGSEKGWDAYLAGLESEALTAIRARLAAEMIRKPAPSFELRDLEGKTVRSADLKGKVLVVDFWATWCGPCRASMPAMAALVEKFRKDDSVRFLFVNTWQSEEDKVKVVTDFMKKNNYSFHVLMDEKNEVVTSFKVSGIPTKFVVDGQGNIRFAVIGYDGNEAGTIREVSEMIEMARTGKAE